MWSGQKIYFLFHGKFHERADDSIQNIIFRVARKFFKNTSFQKTIIKAKVATQFYSITIPTGEKKESNLGKIRDFCDQVPNSRLSRPVDTLKF